MTRIWAIFPGAGTGSRFHPTQLKQYAQLQQRYVLEHTVQRVCAHPSIHHAVIVHHAEDTIAPQLQLALPCTYSTTTGGQERMHSVFQGLRSIEHDVQPHDWVLVHDVARPCLHPHTLDHFIHQITQHGDTGGVVAIPVRDTLKRAEAGLISATVERQHVWQIQTPQLFLFHTLYRALQRCLTHHIMVTDESSAVQLLGEPVRIIEGRSDNIKITYPDDLSLAEHILNSHTALHT